MTRSSERGQVVGLVAVSIVVLLGMTSLTIDVGRALWIKRQLQASVDNAAHVGSRQLPSFVAVESAVAAAMAENPVRGTDGVPPAVTVTSKCVVEIPGCSATRDNAVEVRATVSSPTLFGSLFGHSSFEVGARGTACSPCTRQNIDMVLVFDRTGSMSRNNKMTFARDGLKSLVGFFEPESTHIGLAVLPPARSVAERCDTPPGDVYDQPTSTYLVVPLSDDYKNADGTLRAGSKLIDTIECVTPKGTTAYANAIEAAQAELVTNGRKDARKVIVFFTDGAANTGPHTYPADSPYRRTPCQQGGLSAQAATAAGTEVYAVGYDLDNPTEICRADRVGAPEGVSTIAALQAIASTPETFFNQPDASGLKGIFARVAAEIARGSRLIA